MTTEVKKRLDGNLKGSTTTLPGRCSAPWGNPLCPTLLLLLYRSQHFPVQETLCVSCAKGLRHKNEETARWLLPRSLFSLTSFRFPVSRAWPVAALYKGACMDIVYCWRKLHCASAAGSSPSSAGDDTCPSVNHARSTSQRTYGQTSQSNTQGQRPGQTTDKSLPCFRRVRQGRTPDCSPPDP